MSHFRKSQILQVLNLFRLSPRLKFSASSSPARAHQIRSSHRVPHKVMTPRAIELDAAETLFRQCLLDCRSQIDVAPGSASLELRFTGGWVRDKLLGVKSHDIDVALSTMTGWQFGLALQEFVASHGSAYEDAANQVGVTSALGNLHQIAANPEKSKHLETITTKMFGLDVDFVNLRKETYSDISRNPEMEFGTPEEDAYRRDATVNSLFYNLDTNMIEDFTKKGLDDMDKKIIRTPLAPYQTFKDDPLRVLRLIRFASRLDYEIDPETQQAMKETTIHDALRVKISRERVGTEVGKMLSGPDPHRALMLIDQLDLYSSVFGNPTEEFVPATEGCPHIYDGLQTIMNNQTPLSDILNLQEEREMCWTLAAYTPWAETGPKASQAAREGIKATNKVVKVLGDAVKNRRGIKEIVNTSKDNWSRVHVGLSLRQWGSSWRLQVLYSMLHELGNRHDDVTFFDIRDKYGAFLDHLKKEDLLEAAEMKPLVDGHELRQVFQAKPGAWMKRAIDMMIEWQLENPSGQKEVALAMIMEKRTELGLA